MADSKLITSLLKGTWNGTTLYTIGDIVTLNGSSYICTQNNTNQTPPNTSYWALLASKGDQGATGATGPTGPQGPKGADGMGTGDVVGPASATDNRIAVFDGATGKLVKDGGKTIAQIEAELTPVDGWINANESWSYASASTITVPSGAASKYKVGDKIKWTQTTVKYGVIKAVTDTLLTIITNTDYVVTNAAITDNYYSHSDPIGFPAYFNFNCNPTGFSGTPTNTSTYATSGRIITITTDISGTSNATTLGFTPPVTLPGYMFGGWVFSPSTSASPCLFEPSGANVNVYKDGALTAWANSGDKRIICSYTHRF